MNSAGISMFAFTLAMFLHEKNVRILNLSTPIHRDRPPTRPRSDVSKSSQPTPTGEGGPRSSLTQAKDETVIYVLKQAMFL
jgi:hypothetical protein